MAQRLKRKHWIWIAIFFGVGLAAGLAASLGAYGFKRAQVRNELKLTGPHAIDRLEAVELGGHKQFILLRGQDRRKPVLLFLHGGPGGSIMADSHLFSRELEKHFVVVHWDQRGAGKSFDPAMAASDYAVSNFVRDTIELIEKLRKRFGVEKVNLVGHSWGTALGMLVVHKRPDLVAAYVGAGQVVDQRHGELLSYNYARKLAAEAGDQEALARLAEIEPPYDYDDPERSLHDLITERTILWEHLAKLRPASPTSVTPGGLRAQLLSPYLSPLEVLRVKDAELHTVKTMWPALMGIDLPKQVPAVDVPVTFIEGRYDYQVPSVLAEQYLRQLKAPSKSLVWLEKSGHDMYFDEPHAFQQAVIEHLQRAARTPAAGDQ